MEYDNDDELKHNTYYGERAQFTLTGEPLPGGGFEIMAITAGEANGWKFSSESLQGSLELWEGAECFVDHDYNLLRPGSRSVRDLGGICTNPRWNGEHNGIQMQLKPLGPSGKLVNELGKELLSEEGHKPRVGFSADILFKAKGREVNTILRVLSLDLVFNPARGGAFLRALNSVYPNEGGTPNMEEKTNVTSNPEPDRLAAEVVQAQKLAAAHAEQEQRAKEAEEAKQVRLQMCGYLLDTALSSSRLPSPFQGYIRRQFEDRIFEADELNKEIDAAKQLLSEMQANVTVQGPRIQGMFDSGDKLQAAVDDLLGAPREHGAESVKVARLSGIKELYMMLTGDRDVYGGYYADRVTLATTADFTGLVKNAMNKIVANQWEALGASGYDWWMKITQQEHFDTLNTITGILVGTVGSLPSVSEGAAYQPLEVGDSLETADFTKYGGYIPLTLELIDRDDTRKLRLYPRELAKAGMRLISGLVSAVFTDNAGVGPTMADTGALFNATAVTTAGGHANLLTTALSASQWETVKNAVYSQPLLIKNSAGYYGTGAAMALDPRFLVVPKELELTAKKILYGEYDSAASVIGTNLQRGAFGDVVVVPEWTDANNWAAVVDPGLVPGIVVGERFGLMPEIFIAGDELSPAVFTNDEHRLKVRHFVAVLVQDFRPLHKSNVA